MCYILYMSVYYGYGNVIFISLGGSSMHFKFILFILGFI
jgi:hypothetical protein